MVLRVKHGGLAGTGTGVTQVNRCAHHSETDPPDEHISEHHPIAHQAVQWVFEGGRSVFLEAIVSNPGKPVADDGQEQQIEELGRYNGVECNEDDEQAADEVKPAAVYIAMFFKVVRIEVREIAECLLLAHRASTGSLIVFKVDSTV